MIISLSIGILSRLTAVSRFHLQSMKKKCSEKSGWDKEKEVARRDEADQRRDARENERRRRQKREREREGEEFASKQAKFQKSSKKPEAVGCCYAATIDHLGGRRRDS